jgi:hypothetical protein
MMERLAMLAVLPLFQAGSIGHLTPSVDALGGALGQYIGGDGRLIAEAGGPGIVVTGLAVLGAFALGAASVRSADRA